MRILIIDNEIQIRQGLQTLLQTSIHQINIIEEADSVETGKHKIISFIPDIVFLDVELEDGSGFDLLQQLNNYSFQLIFITAHEKYAINAFKFSAIDFLLKPINPEELEESLKRAYKNIEMDSAKQLAYLFDRINNRNEPPKKIVLKDLHTTYFIKIEEILFCEADGIYTKFFLATGQEILVSKNLKEYENLLEPLGFLRTHHSFLVNPNKIKLFDKTDGGSLVLENGKNIPVSQRKKEHILRILESQK